MMDGATQLALSSLVDILISLACILVCWWVLTGVRLEVIFKKGRKTAVKALHVILALVLGHQLATFFIDYLGWSKLLGQLF